MTRAGLRREIERERVALRHGDALAAGDGRVVALETRFASFRPDSGSGLEPLDVVDPRGAPRGVTAPRWLCHLLGLRHRSAHLVLVGPRPSDLIVLQVRAAWKDTAPGRLDTAVGGHVRSGGEPRATALAELGEELGLAAEAIDGVLHDLGTVLAVDASTARVRDVEVISIFAARLTRGALAGIRFPDGEVSRLVLAPPDECWRFLARGDRRLAGGGRAVLPRVLEAFERGEL